MKRLKTVSGKPLNPIGIGTWGLGGAWEAVYGNEDAEAKAIRYSISVGQNHIDSGEIYGAGHTDEIIGQAIAGIKRQDLFLTDKLWETSVSKGKVRPAVEIMLKKLGTDYLDMLYIHKPWDNWPWKEAIPQINQLMDEGLVLNFGASNFTVQHLKETAKLSKHPLSANQLHFNVLNRLDVSKEMQDYCEAKNIQIIAYKPLERGEVLKNEIVKKIAKKNNISASQVALSWLLQQGVLVVTQAGTEEFINENIAAAKIKLSKDDITQLSELQS